MEVDSQVQPAAERLANILGLCPVVLVHSGKSKEFYVLNDVLTRGYKTGSPFVVDVLDLGAEWKDAAKHRAPQVALPHVWIGSKCYGSYDELMKLHSSGQLMERLRDVAFNQLSKWQQKAKSHLTSQATKPPAR